MRKIRVVMASLLAAVVTISAAAVALGADRSFAPAIESAVGPRIDAGQRQRLAAKLALIERIVHAAEPDMQAQQTSVDSRRWMLETLYTMPLERIQTIGVPGSFAATSAALTKAQRTKALGDASTDLVYRPITPCRFIDTRNVGGAISGSRTFDLSVLGSTYGGSAGCNILSAAGVPTTADIGAVAINVAIVSPTAAPGFIGARPVGSTNTTALVNWYEAGAQVQASNAGAISTFQGPGDDIELFGSPTQVVVDVFGVFTLPGATALECITTASNSLDVPNGSTTETLVPAPACPAGYTHVSVLCGATTGTGFYLTKTGDGGSFSCSYINLSGSTNQGEVRARCCRVPGQ